ncbi:hypothetical protein BCR42DRAFT_492902 [Absidia repens]|uniref:BHLH domain-containing protein n=1 Tax=Absidia repens TaxID=90262 RepID=A0A1X2IBN8_9FUNG|nr:hypothetical protein BCR42DRAFT_492902 [Absidia repens]
MIMCHMVYNIVLVGKLIFDTNIYVSAIDPSFRYSMYNVPFRLSSFNPQSAQQSSSSSSLNYNSDNNASHDLKPFTTLSSLNSSPQTSPVDISQQQQLPSTTTTSYQAIPASPVPSHSTPALTMTNSHNITGRAPFDLYDKPNFKHQQQMSPHPTKSTISASSPNNKNTYYANNDDWTISSNSTTTGKNHNQEPDDEDNYVGSPHSGTIDDELQQQHMQQIFEKKRRRRESHNAVERRRRDNINERIFELSTLLPDRDAIKNNKGTILRKSVEHIRLLHEQVGKCQNRIQELENMMGMYRMRSSGVGDMGLDIQQQQQHSPSSSLMHQPPHPSMDFSSSIPPQLAYRRDA